MSSPVVATSGHRWHQAHGTRFRAQRLRQPDQVRVQEPPRMLVAVGGLETKAESRRQGRRRTGAVGISSVHPLQRPSFSHLLHLLQVSEPLLEESYGRRVDDGRGGLAAAVPSHWRLERGVLVSG
ncbi:unnamed protein product [Miscanthus lutarioriparius]|uniref:Uncharacterized protein n=1 Tax=Miscanthus lutarioriparius TaxID=422564 RepID=A0A811MHK5_9POAL|nr:unnamed protein product [Miscanthus lutarioriparius]